MKNIFFELLIPNTNLIVVEIIYRPPSQTEFLEIMNTHLINSMQTTMKSKNTMNSVQFLVISN